MQNVDCGRCGKHLPLADTAMLKERHLCEECATKAVEAKEATWGQFVRNVDATVCFRCGKDNRDAKFELLAGLGACPECTAWLRNRPFPNWVKMAILGMVAFSVLATVWNWRFVDAYLDVRASTAAMTEHDTSRAVLLAESAMRSVPESASMSLLLHYYKGIDFLWRDNDTEAYAEFELCCQMCPGEQAFRDALSQAAYGKAFEDKDYDEFLRLGLAYAEAQGEARAAGALAAAYACKYAVTHDEQYKAKAMEYLAKAKEAWASDDQETYEAFEARMVHRMDTGQVLKRAAYIEQYPDGYKAGKEQPQ